MVRKKSRKEAPFFFNLNTNNLRTEYKVILGSMCDYYKNPYSLKLILNEKSTYIQNCKVNTLFDTEKKRCGAFSSINECKEFVLYLKI